MTNHVVLSIGLLASDRKESITACLRSLDPIRAAIPSELIILDTGCGKEVRALLEQYGDIVEDFVWCNDFSAARNKSLALAGGEWFMYLDDDEWFTDTRELIDFFRTGEYQSYGSASYIQRNYLDAEGSQYTDTWVGRMAKRTQELRFRSKIHEYLSPISGANKNLRAIVDHYGYVYPTEEAKRKHFERNRTLLQEMIEAEPDKLRWRLQLLQEYRSMDDYEMMNRLGREGLAMLGEDRTDLEARIYCGSFYAASILAKMGQNDYMGVGNACQYARCDARNTRLFDAFCCSMLARACFFIGMEGDKEDQPACIAFAESQEYVRQYLEHEAYFKQHTGELYQTQVAPFVGECFDPTKGKEMVSIYICDGLKLHSTENLDNYMDRLGWDGQNIYVFEEIAGVLIEAMDTLPAKDREGDSEEAANYRAFSRLLQIMYRHSALWKYFCGEIQSRQQGGQELHGVMRLIALAVPEALSEETRAFYASEAEAASSSAAFSAAGQAAENARKTDGSREDAEELRQLTAQVKEQLRLLAANGMKEQAKGVLLQLKQMLPDDGELAELEDLLS